MAFKKKTTSTALVKWDEELAKQAQMAAAVEESTATGSFFSLKGGQLSFNDAPLPNNEMAVIILDGVLENVYYGSEYDPDNVQSPICFAFGRDEKTMEPHKVVIEAGNSQAGASGRCAECEMNQWGSAERGRGKACRNSRRLAMIPGGTFENGRFKPLTDAEQLEQAGIAYMKLPVTSVKGYAAFVKQIAGALKRPPHAIFTKVSVRPDPNTQFKVVFEPLTQVPDSLLGVIMKRHEEAKASIEFPYMPADETEAPAPRGKSGKAAPPARGKATPARNKRY